MLKSEQLTHHCVSIIITNEVGVNINRLSAEDVGVSRLEVIHWLCFVHDSIVSENGAKCKRCCDSL